MTYADAWLQEMWPPVREQSAADRARQRVDDAVARERYEHDKPTEKGR